MQTGRNILVCLLILVISAVGCGNDGDGGGGKAGAGEHSARSGLGSADMEPGYGGRLVIGMQQEPEILNEAVNSMVSIVYVCNFIFSKFVKHNDRMELVPDLITEIPAIENGGISDDYLRYTYHLRKDARWHDGAPVTSADVRFTYNLMIHPQVNVETRQGWDIIESVETPDPHTVIFNLSEAYSNFTGDCFYDESVLPAHLLEGEVGPNFQGAPFHRHPVGSGPFIFKEWVAGSHITLTANEDYYGDGPYLDEVEIRFIPDGNALVIQLETGAIMGIDNAPIALLDVVASLPEIEVFRNPALFNEHIDLNCDNPILGDKRVRRALSLAADRNELSEKIYEGVWIPAYSDDHPNSPYHTETGKIMNSYNPGEAGRLLDDVGWIDNDGDGIREKDGQELQLVISTTAGRLNRERTELVLREQYGKVGIDLQIKNYHPTVMFGSYDEGGILKNGDFDMALYAFLTPPDPSTKEGSYSARFVPPAGQNYSRLKIDRLTRLLSEGSREIVFERRKGIYDEVAVILAEEAPIIPLLWVVQLDAMPRSLNGYRPNPTQSGDSWNANEWWFSK